MKIKKIVVLLCPILSIFLLTANCNCAIETISVDHSNKHSSCHNENPCENSCCDSPDHNESICGLTQRVVLSPKYYHPGSERYYFSHIVNPQSHIFIPRLCALRTRQFIASLDPPSKFSNTQFYISIFPNHAPPISS